eukprot:4243054-Pleurochrysis_carterae.AAC.1
MALPLSLKLLSSPVPRLSSLFCPFTLSAARRVHEGKASAASAAAKARHASARAHGNARADVATRDGGMFSPAAAAATQRDQASSDRQEEKEERKGQIAKKGE